MPSPKTWLEPFSQRFKSGLATALATAFVGWMAWQFQANEWLTRTSYDLLFLFLPLKTPHEVVIVYQDERSYDLLQQKRFARWDRRWHAKLIDTLRAEQARGVVFDILFDDPSDDAAEDSEFARALAVHGKTILAGSLEIDQTSGTPFKQYQLPFDHLRTNAWGWGLGTVDCDDDNTVRMIFGAMDEHPGLPWKTLELMQATPPGIRPDLFSGWMRYYGPSGTLPKVSYADAVLPEGTPPGFFRDKIVFVGARLQTGAYRDTRDYFRHPMNLGSGEFIPGVEVHATAFLNLLHKEWLRKIPDTWEVVLLLMAGVAAGYLLVLFRPWAALAMSVGFALALGGTVVALLWSAHAWFSWLVTLLVQLPVALSGSVLFHFMRLHTEKLLLKDSLSQHLDPARVQQLLRNPDLRKRGGDHVTISIMFSDIAHFSKISGRMHTEDLIKLLNQYFETSLNIVHEQQGTVIKLLGDSIFAIWNAPVDQSDHPQKACATALQLRDALASFNTSQGRLPLRTRIGLHTGLAFVGNVGSSVRFDYTAIGESVNLASRLEGLNKYLGTDILASRDIQKSVEGRVVSRMVGYFRLQGFDRVVEVHELIGGLDQAEATRSWRESFAEALHQFHCRNFTAAEAGFRRTLELRPDDQPSQYYLRQIEHYRKHPPHEDWAGEIELQEK